MASSRPAALASRTACMAGELTPSLDAFAGAWVDLQMRVGLSGVAGPLDVDVTRAGAGVERRLQRAITHQWAARDELHARIMLLPRTDTRREAWLSADALSRQWVTTPTTVVNLCHMILMSFVTNSR